MKKFISIFLATAISVCLLSACEKTEPEITETVTAVATEQNLTETIASEATTVATEETTPEEAVTTAPETEATTTASVTTADNSSDTRTTQQKLDDVIAANPGVEIGYALYNPKTNKYLYHYNEEMKIDVSGEVPVYWLHMILEQNDLELKIPAYLKEDNAYNNSYIYELYKQEVYEFNVRDLINYYFNEGDLAAKRVLEIQEPLIYGEAVSVSNDRITITERDGLEESSIPKYLAKWININKFLNEGSEESEFLRDLLANTNRDSYFYEGTGIATAHVGDNINSEYYDTGVVTVNGVDYIYVIYTKNAESADIVRDISRYFYDDLT